MQSRYYDYNMGRFINADALVSTGQGILGNNMFAYCGNNPVTRADVSGCFWGTLASIGIGAIASVVTSAIISAINGEEFTIGDAVGAAIEGAAATAMIMVGIPVVVANPTATFCGEVWGHFIEGDTSAEAMQEIKNNTAKTAIATTVFWAGGKMVSAYAGTYVSGKYIKLNVLDEVAQDLAYTPKFLNEFCVTTAVSDNFWDSTKSIFVEIIAKS